MSLPVELTDLHVHHGAVRAVDGVTLRIAPGTVCALLGRNGAGKTTLLSTVAAYRRPTSGTVRVGGADPYEDPAVVAEVGYVPASRQADAGTSVGDALDLAALARPRWDGAYAAHLLDRFGLTRQQGVDGLSTGARSALSVAVGLAARTAVTLFDEAHLGMDAVARYAFYDELVAECAAHPRTMVVSSHLVDEVAPLVEDVVVLDRGRVLEHRPVDELQGLGAELTGPAPAVAALAAGRRVLAERSLGRTTSAVVFGPLDEAARREAAATGVDVGPLPLQDLVVHLTSQSQEVPS